MTLEERSSGKRERVYLNTECPPANTIVDLGVRNRFYLVVLEWRTEGRHQLPYWMSKVMQYYIRPVAAKLGIPLKGWYTLRHSYTTPLRQNGNDPKVVQDLLRQASYQITANIYDSAVSDEKREAHSGVIRLVTRAGEKTDESDEFPKLLA